MTNAVNQEAGAVANWGGRTQDSNEKPGWDELVVGGVILEAGNAEAYETGDWRTRRPVFHPERCIHCLFCWAYCPDASILVKDGKVVGIDYFHCKGCGICSAECPVKGEKALTMEDESKIEGGKE